MRIRELVAVLVMGCAAATAAAGAGEGAMPEMSAEEKAMMEKWAKVTAKGPQHAMLAKSVGKFAVTSKSWMGGPGSEPTTSTGTAVRELVLDGRYVRETFKGDMMGMPFEGLGYNAYDNFKKKYVATWMDSMSTGVFQMLGTCTNDHKRCTYFGQMDEPLTDEPDKTVRATVETIDADTSVFTMYDMLPGGQEFKAMELTYKRMK